MQTQGDSKNFSGRKDIKGDKSIKKVHTYRQIANKKTIKMQRGAVKATTKKNKEQTTTANRKVLN